MREIDRHVVKMGKIFHHFEGQYARSVREELIRTGMIKEGRRVNMRRELEKKNEGWVKKAAIAMALLLAVFTMGYALFQYLLLGLPYYLHSDEPITTDRVMSLVNNGTIALNYFRYPGLNFYYGVIVETVLNAVGKLQGLIDALTHQGLVRVIYVFTAWLSGLLMYFPLKSLLGSRSRAAVGTVIGMYSMYLPGELWYAGPDTLLYAFGNIALLLLVKSLDTQDKDRVAFWLMPIWGIFIGFAVSVKYHAALMAVYMVWIFIRKKLYRVEAYKFAFLFSLVLIPLVFVCCNLYMFQSFDGFISDILWNFNHYEGSHQGLDSAMPLVDYALVFLTFGFGIGGGFILLEIGNLIRKRRTELLVSLLLLPVITLLVLGRYKLFLSRNVAFTMPFSNVLFVMGFYTLLDSLKKKKPGRILRCALVFLLCVTMTLDVYSLIATTEYQDSRDLAGQYIAENVEEGSTIFTRTGTNANGIDRMPGIDPQKYTLVTSAFDADEGDIVVDTSGRYARFYKKGILGAFGKELYSSSREAYERELGDFTLIKRFEGLNLSSATERSDYLPMRLWLAIFADRDSVYWGPTIDIYVNQKAPDFSGITLTSAMESIEFTGQSDATVKLHVNNGTGATLYAKGTLVTKLTYALADASGNVVKRQTVEGCLTADIGPRKEADIEFKCPLDGLTVGESYTLEIDLTKSTTGSYAEKGMQPLRIPIVPAQAQPGA